MNSLTIQRLFRTQISGINQNENRESSQIRNMKVSHQDTTGGVSKHNYRKKS